MYIDEKIEKWLNEEFHVFCISYNTVIVEFLCLVIQVINYKYLWSYGKNLVQASSLESMGWQKVWL